VEHLRLEERRAITGDNRPGGTVNGFRQNRNAKNLMPFHLPASVWPF
jgi:hypothetical protein